MSPPIDFQDGIYRTNPSNQLRQSTSNPAFFIFTSVARRTELKLRKVDRRSAGNYIIGVPVTDQQVMAKLRECYDPELPCNIVDLGLVYDVKLQKAEGADDTRVDVKMTLTSQSCPLSGQISAQVQRKLLELQGVGEANVEVIFDPPWSFARISPGGKQTLGLP